MRRSRRGRPTEVKPWIDALDLCHLDTEFSNAGTRISMVSAESCRWTDRAGRPPLIDRSKT